MSGFGSEHGTFSQAVEAEKPPAQEPPVKTGSRDLTGLLFTSVASDPPPGAHRHALFLAELVFTLPFVYLYVGMFTRTSFFFKTDNPALVRYIIVGTLALVYVLVYYGTSFQATPFTWFVRRMVGAALLARSPALKPDLAPATVKPKLITDLLAASAENAFGIATRMERRINTHLILGIIVGLVGLLVWYLSFYLNEGDVPTDPWGRFWQFFPRVTILLFIELLAGFFLRQYRIGVEDLKYFLERARKADMNTTAFSIFDAINDVEGKKEFAKAMVAEKAEVRLAKDETTPVLEAMKVEENMTLKLIGILGDHLESVTKLIRKDK
jgi:uncharacterized membrane protein YdcZ (DUF606 family)